MTPAQIEYARSFTGTPDEAYFARLALLGDPEPGSAEQVAEEPAITPVPVVPDRPAPVAGTRPRVRDVGVSPEPVNADLWIIERVLRPGAYLVVAAPEGLGKSYIRKELAIRRATGTGALFGHYPIVGAGTVLDFDEENGGDEEWRREEDVFAALGIDRAAVAGSYFSVSFAGLSLTDAASQAYVREQVAATGADVVMLDTGTSMVGDEWGAEFKSAVRFLRSLSVEFGAAVVVFVHLTKPPRERGRTTRHGSAMADVMGQWTRQADAVALMADLGEGRATWTMRKRVPPSSLVIRQASGIWEVVNVNAAELVRKSGTDDRVLRAVIAGATSAQEIAAGLGLPERTVYAAVKRLRRDRLLEDEFPYRATATGAEAADAA